MTKSNFLKLFLLLLLVAVFCTVVSFYAEGLYFSVVAFFYLISLFLLVAGAIIKWRWFKKVTTYGIFLILFFTVPFQVVNFGKLVYLRIRANHIATQLLEMHNKGEPIPKEFQELPTSYKLPIDDQITWLILSEGSHKGKLVVSYYVSDRHGSWHTRKVDGSWHYEID